MNPQESADLMRDMFKTKTLKSVSGDTLNADGTGPHAFTFIFEDGCGVTFFADSTYIVSDQYTYHLGSIV